MNKHKHYQAIRAFADGWGIERFNSTVKKWIPSSNPHFGNLVEQFRIVPDENGWLPWYGGKCPVPKNAMVQYKLLNGAGTIEIADELTWGHGHDSGDIVAYRVIEKPKKIKMWQWVLRGCKGNPFISGSFYACPEDVLKALTNYTILQRADWTEIEVEVKE